MFTIHSQPLIPILPLGQLHHLPQTPTPQRRLGKLLQLPGIRPLSPLRRLESRCVAAAAAAAARAGIAIAARQEVSLLRYILQPFPEPAAVGAVDFMRAVLHVHGDGDVGWGVRGVLAEG